MLLTVNLWGKMAKGVFDEFQDNCSIHRELKSKLRLVLHKYNTVICLNMLICLNILIIILLALWHRFEKPINRKTEDGLYNLTEHAGGIYNYSYSKSWFLLYIVVARPTVSRNMIQICIMYMELVHCGYIDIVNYHIYLTRLINNQDNVMCKI